MAWTNTYITGRLIHCQLPDNPDSDGFHITAKDCPVVVQGPGLTVRRVPVGETAYYEPRAYWWPLRVVLQRLGVRSYRWVECEYSGGDQ